MLIRGLVGAMQEPKSPKRKRPRNTYIEPPAKVHVEKMTVDMIASNGKPITSTQAATVFKLFARGTGILEGEREIRDHCESFKDELREELKSRRDDVSRIKDPNDGEIAVVKGKIRAARSDLKSAKTKDEKDRAEMELAEALEILEHWKEELELTQASLKELMDDKRQYLVEYVNRNYFEKSV